MDGYETETFAWDEGYPSPDFTAAQQKDAFACSFVQNHMGVMLMQT